MQALGTQLLVEMFECDAEVLNDLERLTLHMLEAARRCGATILSHHFHRFNPHGLSGVVVIAESHLAIHTWPEHHYAALDLFTCGANLDADAGFSYLEQAFRAGRCEKTPILRGIGLRSP